MASERLSPVPGLAHIEIKCACLIVGLLPQKINDFFQCIENDVLHFLRFKPTIKHVRLITMRAKD